jgi:hypothetical protein
MPEAETVNVKIPFLPLCIWLMAGLCCVSARAQAVTVHSASRQFTARQLQRQVFLPAKKVQSLEAGGWAYLLSYTGLPALGNKDEVALEPSTLVVSCERLKALVLDKLGMVDQWQGTVDLTINPVLAEEKGPQLTATHWPKGWTYQLEFPRSLQEEILMRSLIQTLLLEIANRQGGVQSAEIPLWLVEGLGAELQAKSFPTFIVQRGQSWSANIVWNKGSETMSSELGQHPPLSFQQLSWPQESDLTPAGLPLYRSCAQLLLEELLRFDDGRDCLRSMITHLPEHWNWQTAFLLAFHSHFDQLLDVEKWWGVNCVDFSSGYTAQPWSASDCRKKLQESLDVPVEVHFGPDQMPVEAKITLQEAIRQWRPADALDAVKRAIGGLKLLVPRSTPELRPLTESYLKTLLDYSKAAQTAGIEQQLGRHAPSLINVAKANAIEELDMLDLQRQAIWTNSAPAHPPQLSAAGQPEGKSADGR